MGIKWCASCQRKPRQISIQPLTLTERGHSPTTVMYSQWLLCGVLVLLAVSYGVYGQGLSEEEKEEILNAHNHYRGQVDPIASNMLMMVKWRNSRFVHFNYL